MKNVIFAGVGGQGVILASKVLMEVAQKRGFDVKESEVHGMAQRGGSVDCNVRYGTEVFSPLIPKGGADFVVSLEMLESMRKIDYLKKDAVLIVNREQINPAPVEIGAMKYPEDIEEWLRKNFANTVVVDTTEALKEAGTKKALNIVMLGCLSKYLDFEMKDWEDAIKALVKEQFVEQNLKAFTLGRELIRL
ncbi:MAG TPA: indolepyruvate oxidoreductase subunit beta [Spirochaetota bacterium]|nr:indolepyruvate oxidoreductase subunit beta [Spirochaetota bacterium]HPF05524.1 indolepyruvate oxidoreductase subunit beta [Spirochaetota bacterium]HPJ41381.1 indolepyruvate oxidoreductase subunit beta [Spirochaetota bacterium]HPR38149.1 indolepyruvate oxidoreductase subunit beta [Spirochaetota bacterium]HRX47680.1 indolepyruvate oxidoreductase subunit beta [Spirochaetota bacterium]